MNLATRTTNKPHWARLRPPHGTSDGIRNYLRKHGLGPMAEKAYYETALRTYCRWRGIRTMFEFRPNEHQRIEKMEAVISLDFGSFCRWAGAQPGFTYTKAA